MDRTADLQAQAEARLSLGAGLRAVRNNAGLTQEQVAHILGMKPSKISEIENGHKGLRWYTVTRYLEAVSATLHHLADEMDKNQGAAPRPASNGPSGSARRAQP
jgi:transcriptional regulator with XRE-family HTH domain